MARAALAASADAPMNAIARAAGVGAGTLYRHFPDRAALVMAVYREDLRELAAAGPALLTAHPVATGALREWLEQLAAFVRFKHGVAEALQDADRLALDGEGYRPVVETIDLLLDAGQRTGTIRADIDASDLLLLVGFLWHPDAETGDPSRAARQLDVVIAGLRPPSEPLA